MLEASTIFWKINRHEFLGIWWIQNHKEVALEKLTQHRINYLKGNSQIEIIRVRTSQHAYKFYEKMGFKLEKIKRNYWAKNFDMYIMQMKN